jgi:hypothetical protein
MLQAPTESRPDIEHENARVRQELELLREENVRLRDQNRHLRAALDAHVARAGSSSLFGPLEMSAGTCVGPRRRRATPTEGGGPPGST